MFLIFICYNESNKCYCLSHKKKAQERKKATVYNNASEMYNVYLETYFDQYMALPNDKKKKVGSSIQ